MTLSPRHPITPTPTPPSPRHPFTPTPNAFDALIVGGGIAGSTLAIVLARAGVAVAVVERERAFRDRVRGEALMPWGASLARELGILDALAESGSRYLPIWQTYDGREPLEPYDWRWDVPSGDAVWGVRHPGLQDALLERAAAAGATVLRPAKALRPRRSGERHLVPVKTEGGEVILSSRLVVGADGGESGVRTWIAANTVRDPVRQMIGGLLLDGVDLDPDAAHIAAFPGGRAMLFRQASGKARAYLVTRPEVARTMRGANAAPALIAASAAALPAGALKNAQPAGPAAFFSGADIFADRIVGDGVVLIGDAAGANDPCQGHGVSLVFKDVHELSRLLLVEADWQNAVDLFSERRAGWYEPLRAHAMWEAPLVTGVGQDSDAARERVARAKERDPLRGGYAAIHAFVPHGLPVTDAARRHYLGDDLDDAATAAD